MSFRNCLAKCIRFLMVSHSFFRSTSFITTHEHDWPTDWQTDRRTDCRTSKAPTLLGRTESGTRAVRATTSYSTKRWWFARSDSKTLPKIFHRQPLHCMWGNSVLLQRDGLPATLSVCVLVDFTEITGRQYKSRPRAAFIFTVQCVFWDMLNCAVFAIR